MKKSKLFVLALIFSINYQIGITQVWKLAGNFLGGGEKLGSTSTFPVDLYTNNLNKATLTSNFSLGPLSIIPLVPAFGNGDGFKIIPRTSGCALPAVGSLPDASLDLLTSCSNGTHIRWDKSGQISGTNSRFEVWASNDGFYFNAQKPLGPFFPRYIFATNQTEQGRIGVNRFWRIGENGTNVNATRRLEVGDFNLKNSSKLCLTVKIVKV